MGAKYQYQRVVATSAESTDILTQRDQVHNVIKEYNEKVTSIQVVIPTHLREPPEIADLSKHLLAHFSRNTSGIVNYQLKSEIHYTSTATLASRCFYFKAKKLNLF